MIHRIAIFLLLLRCIAPCVYASDAEDLYRKHITNIEPNSVTQLEGYLFSSASFIPSSQSSPAITGALKRAHFQAKIQIFDKVLSRKYNFEGLGVDESLEGQFTVALRNVLREGTHLDLSGIQVVFQAKSQAVSKCVMAMPIENLEGFLSSDLDARQLILASAFNGNYELDPVLVSELSTVDQFEKVTSFWCRSLELNYQSEGLSDTLNYKPISKFPNGIVRKELLVEDGFKSISFREGLQYCSLFLNFPTYARSMAEKARLENFPVTESVFLYFGACYPIEMPDQIHCAAALEGRGLLSLISKHAGRFASIDEANTVCLTGTKNLDFILTSLGGFRLIDSNLKSPAYREGGIAFSSDPPDLISAERLYSKAIEESISSNACNMLGRCYALNGSPVKAVVLLTQAIIINPTHPYAGANLALALQSNGLTDEAINQAHRALENPDISDFGKNELKNLLNRIQ
jgi:tetratricopeptide (TPR) repeat protein